MTNADLIPIVDEGLGNAVYLLSLGDGRALAVDASRDLRGPRAAAERRGLTVAFAADTHLHADFLTGALQLAASDGASVLASAEGGRSFPHHGLRDGDEVDLGGLTLRTIATPGHTHEHLAFTGDTMPPLQPLEVKGLAASGAVVVDVRPVPAFAEGHVPDSVSIPLRGAFATWLGGLVDAEKAIVIVRDADQDPAEILWQARKIGYDTIVGELAGGLPSWTAASEATASIPLLHPRDVKDQHVLDIRQEGEFATGHVPNAEHVELGRLAAHVSDLPTGPTVVMCGHGERAMGAASILQRSGKRDVAVLDGGPEDWAHASGRSLEVSR